MIIKRLRDVTNLGIDCDGSQYLSSNPGNGAKLRRSLAGPNVRRVWRGAAAGRWAGILCAKPRAMHDNDVTALGIHVLARRTW